MKKIIFLALFVLLWQPVFSQNFKKNKLEKFNLNVEKLVKKAGKKIGKNSGIIRAVYNNNARSSSTKPLIDLNKAFDGFESRALGIDNNNVKRVIYKESVSPAGNHAYYRQYYKGIPIYGTDSCVTVGRNNSKKNKNIYFMANNFKANVKLNMLKPKVSASKAINIAKKYLSASQIIHQSDPELMIFDSKDKGFESTWKIQIMAAVPQGDWLIFVNAINGRVVHVKDENRYLDGQGMIYNPDPLTSTKNSYGGNYSDNDDKDSVELSAARVSVPLKDISLKNSKYSLNGPYCVITDVKKPTNILPELSDSKGFIFTRSQDQFEAVMAYYHIDKSARRLMDLGFALPDELKIFKCDPLGDDSYYSPGSNMIVLGTNGVDAAEDADIIWHEHAHTFQEHLAQPMDYYGETYALMEGCADYWAFSYSRSLSNYNWAELANWANHSWPAYLTRRADENITYSDIPLDSWWHHNDGQVWTAPLMKIWKDLGRDITDKLFLQSHYIWGSYPGFTDAAQAFIQADLALYNGKHLSTIIKHFKDHELIEGEVIESLPYTHRGSTIGASDDWVLNGIIDGPDNQYFLHLDEPASITVSTCSPNTNYNTKIAIFTIDGSDIDLFNDDDLECSVDRSHSTIKTAELPADSYYIVVDGAWAQFGDYELTVTKN